MQNELKLGREIRRLRLQKKLRLCELIRKTKLKVRSSYLSRIELYGTIPGRILLKEIARLLNVSNTKLAEIAIEVKLEKAKNRIRKQYFPTEKVKKRVPIKVRIKKSDKPKTVKQKLKKRNWMYV